MSDEVTGRAAEPDGAPRIAILDILRGVAILGILFMNINDMGTSFRAGGDIRHFGWGPADQVVWVIREVLANGTARCLLEMLFGAGMVILTERVSRSIPDAPLRGRARRVLHWLFGDWIVMRRYYWRNIVLYAFGLVHVFILLWPGDILHTYAIAALVAFLFRRLSWYWLIPIGLIAATLQFGFTAHWMAVERPARVAEVARVEARQAVGLPLTKADTATLEKERKRKAENAREEALDKAEVVQEDKDRSGTTWTWVREATNFSIERLAWDHEIFSIWEAAGTMLIGAALFKLGILQGRRSRRYYLALAIIAYLVGGSLRAVGAAEQMRFDDEPQTIWATYEYARLIMTVGHIAFINWLVTSGWGARMMRPFVAAGRTALSIYVVQTIICLWILYPPFAFALYGKMTWWSLMATGLVINIALLWLANRYVRHYRIAPVEWAWRSIVEWRRLPFRRAAG